MADDPPPSPPQQFFSAKNEGMSALISEAPIQTSVQYSSGRSLPPLQPGDSKKVLLLFAAMAAICLGAIAGVVALMYRAYRALFG
jgi:hypothetical protein